MSRIRLRHSKKSRYYLEPELYMETYWHCMRYHALKTEYENSVGLVRGRSEGASSGTGDPTASQAMRLARIGTAIRRIEDTARAVAPEIYTYLLAGVTERHMTFDRLKAKGMPCERDMYYDRRRKFYWLMAKKLGV